MKDTEKESGRRTILRSCSKGAVPADCGVFGASATKKVRLTKEQRTALKAYEFALHEEDRYLGSVFVTPDGQRRVESRTEEAYRACRRLGMTYEHGL